MNVSRTSQGIRFRAAIIVAVATASLAAPAGTVSASIPQRSALASASRLIRLETLVFRTSLDEFMAVSRRRSGEDASFDWSTDHCSAPLVGSTGRSFDFSSACARHDFAYRNYKRADTAGAQRGQLWNSGTRHKIDLRFQQDMKTHCSRRSIVDRTACHVWAETFYRLVRIAGGP